MQQRPDGDTDNRALLPLTLRVMIVLGIVAIGGGTALAPTAFWGLLSGVALGVLLFLISLQAGRVFTRSHSLVAVMLWLFLAQALIWVGTAILLAVLRVDGIGFAIGISVLPVAVVLTTLYWWLIIHKGVIP